MQKDLLEKCVNMKKLTLYVNSNAVLPESMAEWTPEDTELIISVGHMALLRAKFTIEKTSHREVINDMERSFTKRYSDELESSQQKIITVEKELEYSKEKVRLIREESEYHAERRVAESKDIYDKLLESYRKEREDMQQKIIQLQRDNDNAKRMEIEQMRMIMSEKDKQAVYQREMFEKSIARVEALTQKRDAASLGKIGEGQFRSLATSVFRDFDGFQMKDVHSIGGNGDFHMQFKEFTVLVDSKLYTHNVTSTSRDKIRRDLDNNEHIEFAWLVSMDTVIDRFDKAPFMFEWISPQKCICYINRLKEQEDPGNLLRSAWFCCKAIKQMLVSGESANGELSLLKEREMKMRDMVRSLEKTNRERDSLFSQMRRNFDKADEHVRNLLNEEIAGMVVDYRPVVEWWNKNLVEDTVGLIIPIKSTMIWTKFKQDMASNLGSIDANGFKDILCSFIPEDRIFKPSKAKGSALEIKGYKWRDGVALK